MELAALKELWDHHGRADAMWAVVSDPRRRSRAWDADAFFASGRAHADNVVARLAALGLEPAARADALDFGCGVGRITRGLATHFHHVVGVDIAPSMVERARAFAGDDDRVEFVVNDRADLSRLADASFDLVHSALVLQHIPGEASRAYLAELVRVLRPGGVAVLQVPHAARPAVPATPLPAEGCSARFELAAPAPTRLRCGETATIVVRITNTGTVGWPARVEGDGVGALRLGNHWRLRSGELVAVDDGRAPLGVDVPPGGEAVAALTVLAPGTKGSYVLEVDLVQELVAWFADHGGAVLEVPVEVRRPTVPQRLLARWRAWRSPAPTGPPPAPFGMYAVPRDEVAAVVAGAGGEVAAVEQDAAAGPDWISFTYFITKP